MSGTLIARHGRGFRFAVSVVGVATLAAGAVLGRSAPSAASDLSAASVPSAASNLSAPMLATSGSSDGYRISTVQIGVQAEAIAIDPGTHTVFVGSNKLLTIVDEQTGAVTGTVQLAGSVVALAIDTATHRVYALQQFPQPQPVTRQSAAAVQANIAVIDPSTRSIITTYPNLGYGPAFPSAGNTLVDDPVGHRLFSASLNVTVNGTRVDGATQIDTVTGKVSAVSNGYVANSLAYDPITQALYVADQSPVRTITVVSANAAPRLFGTIEMSPQPDGVALDPSTQTVYVASNDGPSLSVIDGRTNKVVTTIKVGAILSGAGVDASSHTVFAANGADETVTVIDGATRSVTGTIQVGAPQYRVAVDPSTHSVWTTSLGTTITALNPIVTRFAGPNRFATAASIAANGYADDQADAVVLARADNFPDALVGAPLAAAKSAPLLFTCGTALPAVTETEIRRVLAPGKAVYLLGGPSAIPDQIVMQLMTLGYSPIRIAGDDRFATAIAVADALGDPNTIFLASGSDFADALTAGPAATKAHGAVLLTGPGVMDPETASYLSAHSTTVLAIGGPAAAADPTAVPIFGADRFATGVAVAQQFFAAATRAGIASGGTFPDALAASAYLATTGSPLLLSQPTGLSTAVASYLGATDTTITSADIFGGSTAVSALVQTAVSGVLGP
jgi:YVTN family beta-propeller protein